MIDAELARFLGEGLGIRHRDPRQAPPTQRRSCHGDQSRERGHARARVRATSRRTTSAARSFERAAPRCLARPIDDRACQIKGVFAGARPATAEEEPFVIAQWERFLTSLEQIGISRAGLAGWSIWPSVAVRIRVTALFDQTPGPDAGAPLG